LPPLALLRAIFLYCANIFFGDAVEHFRDEPSSTYASLREPFRGAQHATLSLIPMRALYCVRNELSPTRALVLYDLDNIGDNKASSARDFYDTKPSREPYFAQ
jgi:hypothetical protein